MIALFVAHLGNYRAGDHIARGEVFKRMVAPHERFASEVAEHRAFAAHSFRDQEWRRAVQPQSCRVELVELDVGDLRPRFEGKRDPIAGGNFWVGGVRKQSPGAPCCEHNVLRFVHFVFAGLQVHAPHAHDASAVQQQPGRQGVVEHRYRRVGGGGAQGGFDLRACAVAAGVEDARVAVGRLSPKRHLAAQRIEGNAVAHEVLDACRRLRAKHPSRFLIDQPGSGRDRIGQVLLGRVQRPNGGRDAALRPTRVAVINAPLGEHQHRPKPPRLQRHEQPRDTAADDHGRVPDPFRALSRCLTGFAGFASSVGHGLSVVQTLTHSPPWARDRGAR